MLVNYIRHLLARSGQYCHLVGSTKTNQVHAGRNLTAVILPPRREFSTEGEVGSALPGGAQVVICGGGIIGTSVAYHLTQEGWKDVILLEQGSLCCGSTWHASGLVSCLKNGAMETDMASYSRDFYKNLDLEGHDIGWKECGSLFLARTKDRLTLYKRQLITGRRYGTEGEIWSPQQLAELYPFLHTNDIEGAVWVPTDGVVNPTNATLAMAKKAKDQGAQIFERTKVVRIHTKNHHVHAVETDKGMVECQYFINCAGMWARELGQQSEPKVRVPLHPCEHYYLTTRPMDGIDPWMPVIRDFDGYVYMREWNGGILGGGFEPKAKPVFHNGIPDNFEFQLLKEDWDHFQVLLEQLLHRLPALETAQVYQLTNGPESFTPDGKCIMGEAPEVDNYYVAAGMNSKGMSCAPGVGKYMAEWIVNREPSINLWSFDVRRFVDMHNNLKFLQDRVSESLGYVARIPFWDTQTVELTTGRKLRTSPLYTRMEKDAVFGQTMAYERPLYFMSSNEDGLDDHGMHESGVARVEYSSGRKLRTSMLYSREEACHAQFIQSGLGYEKAAWFCPLKDDDISCLDEYLDTELPSEGSFGRPVWFDHVKSEYWACREGVCLIDMSTFTKFELRSADREVTNFLQHVCSNDVDRPVGMVIHTGMQNHRGGYENDCSVVRLADNHYFMIGPTAQQTRAYAWLRDHLPPDGSVQLNDVTSMYTAINVIGPKAQELLAELTDTPLNKQDFHSMTCKVIDVGQASGVKAMRLTHSGEDGWMLYIPSEYALHVYDSLMAAGKNYGVRNAGYYALRALRTEKFFAYWGTDLTPHTTPMECGREYRVKFDVGNFIGHGALLQQKTEGIKKRLVQFLLENHNVDKDPWPWGGEPIYRNGKLVGTATSTAYGFTLDRQVVLGYVSDFDEITGEAHCLSPEFIMKEARYEVDIAGQRFPAKANVYPPTLAPATIIIDTPQRKTFR